jgi:hypothetical protein
MLEKHNRGTVVKNQKPLIDIRAEGAARGRLIASWIEVPEPGTQFKLKDMVTTVSSPVEAVMVMIEQAMRAEEANRMHIEFTPTRHMLDSHTDANEAWGAFADGVLDGIHTQVTAAVRAKGRHYFER